MFPSCDIFPEGAPSEVANLADLQVSPTRSTAITMVGNIYPSRVRFLEALMSEVPVEIHGNLHNDGVPGIVSAGVSAANLSGEGQVSSFSPTLGVS